MKKCPFPSCEFESESERGLKTHVRQAHEAGPPDKDTRKKWQEIKKELHSTGGLSVKQSTAVTKIDVMVDEKFPKEE